MDGSPDRRLLIVAGEPSGDVHAARLVEALRACGDAEVLGVAGPRMIAAGVRPLAAMETLSVMGFTGVLRRLPRIRGVFASLEREVARARPSAAVLVDSPGFNFRLGPRLHRAGIPVFYYIAPQVWAWHPERAAEMARWVRRLAVVFPFEEPIFRAAGVETRWVGHPLLDDFAPEVDERTFRAELGLAPGTRILGLLPGSRAQEIERHIGVLLEAARRLRATRADLDVVVALPPREGEVSPGIERTGDAVVVRGRTRATQAFATACVVASGTATLETALFGTPLVIVYRTGWLNWELGRRLVRLARIGLPNIVAGEDVAPECLQHDLRPEALVGTLAPWLDDPAEREARHRRLAKVRERLGGPGASARAAAWLWDMVA